MRSCAAYISARKSLRLFSLTYPGPLGTTWQSRSCCRRLLAERHQIVARRRLAGLEVPVGREDGLEARHDRTLDLGDELLPLQAAPDVAALVVAAVDDVLRPMKPTSPSTTRILRWLRRSGRWYLPRNGCTGSMSCQHAHAVEPVERLAIALHPQRRDVVEQHPHLHAAVRPPRRAHRRTGRWWGRRRRCRTRRGRTAATPEIASAIAASEPW